MKMNGNNYPRDCLKNAFAMKINKSTCKKEMQQCMQQKFKRLQFRLRKQKEQCLFNNFNQEYLLPSLLAQIH